MLTAPRTVALTHFCEQHGPSIVYTTQMVHNSSNIYTFPTSFQKSKKHISKIVKKLKNADNIHFCFTPPSTPPSSPRFSRRSGTLPTPIEEDSTDKDTSVLSIQIKTPNDPEIAPVVTNVRSSSDLVPSFPRIQEAGAEGVPTPVPATKVDPEMVASAIAQLNASPLARSVEGSLSHSEGGRTTSPVDVQPPFTMKRRRNSISITTKKDSSSPSLFSSRSPVSATSPSHTLSPIPPSGGGNHIDELQYALQDLSFEAHPAEASPLTMRRLALKTPLPLSDADVQHDDIDAQLAAHHLRLHAHPPERDVLDILLDGIADGHGMEDHTIDEQLLMMPPAGTAGVRIRNKSAVCQGRSPSVEITIKCTTPEPKREHCTACSSLKDGNGLFSFDDNSDWYYVSTHHPSPSSYSAVRTACLRSLSCEVGGEDGPVIFGTSDASSNDPEAEWTLSLKFKLLDSRARGGARTYSLMLLMADYPLLVHSVEYITKFFHTFVSEMQQKAEALYWKEKKDQAEQGDQPQRTSSNMLTRGPMRSFGMIRRDMGPSSGPLRSLTELLGDKDFFRHLHTRFCWILRNVENSMTAKLLISPATDTAAIANYKAFISTPILSTTTGNPSNARTANPNIEDSIAMMAMMQNINGIFGGNSDDLGVLGTSPRSGIARLPGSTGPAVCVSKPASSLQFTSHGQLYSQFGPNCMRDLVYSVITGNQIIVRTSSQLVKIAESILDLLKALLPESCCLYVPYSHQYHESYECNFLCIDESVVIPAHVSEACYALIDIRYAGTTSMKHINTGNNTPSSGSFKNLSQTVQRKSPSPEQLQQQLQQQQQAERQTLLEFSYHFPSSIVTTLGKEVDMLLQLQAPKEIEVMRLNSLKLEWLNKAKVFYNVTLVPEQVKDTQFKKFKKTLKLLDGDMGILKFWSKAARRKTNKSFVLAASSGTK